MSAVPKRKTFFLYGGIILGIIFLLAPAGNVRAFYNPSDIILGNPVIQTLQKFYSQNLPPNGPTFQTHVSCGGGDQSKIGVGPTVENITSCSQCQSLATCAGGSAGVSNVGYLWDAHSNQCGLGVNASAATISSCLAPVIAPPGSIPTPCPTSGDRIALKNFIAANFNIHFDDNWSAPSLYDLCTKFYETSGTKFDDFFKNDSAGATVLALPTGLGYCFVPPVPGKVILCDSALGLQNATGSGLTFNIIHELGHTLKALNWTASREGNIESIAILDTGKTTWTDFSHGHISKYPWSQDPANKPNSCPISSGWTAEEYADTITHYLHPALGEISPFAPACAGGSINKPFVDTPANAHCDLMNNVLGPYNPYCADTLGIWQNHSPSCSTPPDVGQCKKTTMLQIFGTHAVDAAQTCVVESGGNPATINTGCTKCPVWNPADPNCYISGTHEYSVGLFQLNLMAQCAALGLDDGISPFTKMGTFCSGSLCWDVGTCQIQNPAALETCKQALGWNNPLKNASEALRIALNWGGFAPGAMGWAPWSGARVCNLVPHP